jgi:hypothetical protein
MIKCSYKLSVKVVNESNIQSKTPSVVTPFLDNIFINLCVPAFMHLVMCSGKQSGWVNNTSVYSSIIYSLLQSANYLFACFAFVFTNIPTSIQLSIVYFVI